MRFKNQQGTVLITLIIAMTLMSALGAAIYSLTASSSFGELLTNNNDNAYDLARAGIRYGISQSTFTFPATTFSMPDANHTFTVSITGGVVTSTGVVNPGSFLEARRVLSYDASWASAPSSSVVTISDLISSSPIVNLVGGQPSAAITTNATANTVNLGGGITDSYGSLWYQGNNTAGYCTNGACSFGTGIRVYFDFTVVNEDYSADSTNSADGFTFTVMSAIMNSRDRTGGAGASSQGELMGYAGPDNTTDSLGLRPPKIALEFDTYPNNGSSDVCASGSRNDPTPFSNHTALMFWGDRTISGTCNGSYPKDSFDDNRHGAGGSGGDPINTATSSDPGYYQGVGQTCKSSANTCNWLEDGYTYSGRMEIVRPTAANGSGAYNYQINAWIMRRSAVNQLAHFQDVMTPYTDAAPQINKTVALAQADHDNFSKIYFGFTEATGGRSQNVIFSDFRSYLAQGTGTCSYAISPTSATAAAAGGTGSIGVTPTAACPWWSATVEPAFTAWLHITSGANGTGSGTVGYTVDANAGPYRTGTMTVAGQTFTVDQLAGACPPLSITTPSLPNGRINAIYTSTTVSASGGVTPYFWSISGLPNGLSINASTGVISGTPTATGLFNPIVTVQDSCPQTANKTYSNVLVKYDTYTITNNTGSVIYQQIGGSCKVPDSISAGGTYSIPYNGAAVIFYQTRGAGNSCSGNSRSVSGANADSQDVNYNGNVQINSNWQLIDN